MTGTWLAPLRPAIENMCSAWRVPLGVVVGWIEVESGGRLRETTSLGERGYFQLTPAESQDLGLQHARLSTDSLYSLSAGFKLIDYYRKIIARLLILRQPAIVSGSEYFWRLVKLAHTMGQGATSTILVDAFAAGQGSSWEALRQFALQNEAHYLQTLKHSPAKWFPFIDRMFQIGAPYGLDSSSLPSGPPVV
jgi:hypothetical protein